MEPKKTWVCPEAEKFQTRNKTLTSWNSLVLAGNFFALKTKVDLN